MWYTGRKFHGAGLKKCTRKWEPHLPPCQHRRFISWLYITTWSLGESFKRLSVAHIVALSSPLNTRRRCFMFSCEIFFAAMRRWTYRSQHAKNCVFRMPKRNNNRVCVFFVFVYFFQDSVWFISARQNNWIQNSIAQRGVLFPGLLEKIQCQKSAQEQFLTTTTRNSCCLFHYRIIVPWCTL